MGHSGDASLTILADFGLLSRDRVVLNDESLDKRDGAALAGLAVVPALRAGVTGRVKGSVSKTGPTRRPAPFFPAPDTGVVLRFTITLISSLQSSQNRGVFTRAMAAAADGLSTDRDGHQEL